VRPIGPKFETEGQKWGRGSWEEAAPVRGLGERRTAAPTRQDFSNLSVNFLLALQFL